MGADQVVEAPSEARRAVCELVREGALADLEPIRDGGEGAVEPLAALGGLSNPKRRLTPRRGCAQSNIPVVGDDGTAISRDGILPARNASRPATIA